MSTPVVMPQMGESIAEGTIVRWIKNVGDSVDRDEPLFEISTDKVDAEIPAPVAGVLTEIKVQAGETVAVNEVVATIGDASEVAWPVASDASSDVAKSSEATLLGDVFDDVATGQGLLNFFLRALNSGAIDLADTRCTGLTAEELAQRSFATILEARKASTRA
jgi:pyruvate/2-oxoglutarate dehydrogenase complex dihydrolipoamide acyltransferase (E2) component